MVPEGKVSVCFIHCCNPSTEHRVCQRKSSLNTCGLIGLLFEVRAYSFTHLLTLGHNSAQKRHQ